MDNLPKDPPDQNNNSTLPPFGSNFNPYQSLPSQPASYPPTSQTPVPEPPNNPNYVHPSIHQEVAQHRPRDAEGHFLPYEHPTNTNSVSNTQINPTQTSLNPSIPSNTPNSSFLPPLIEVNQNTNPSAKEDPPLFGFFITNPVTYLRKFLIKLLKNQSVTIKVPILTIILILTATGGYGVGIKTGLYFAAAKIFPFSSPFFHRPFSDQGIIQKSSSGYFLKTKDNTLWELKSLSSNSIDTVTNSIGKQVLIKGNLTSEAKVIDVTEVISFDTK